MEEIHENMKASRKFYRDTMIAIEEAMESLSEVMKRGSDVSTPDDRATFSVPPCDIPIFKGDYASWASFRDMFLAVYGNNPRLSEVEKLFYLKQKTGDEPKEIVDNAPLTHKGFSVAWEDLRARYDNVRMQINKQIKILLDLPTATTQCGSSVRKLQRTVNSCINHLKLLKVPTDSWDPILIYLCSMKLPVQMLTKFEETLSDPSALPTWVEMDAFLTNTYKGLESVADIKSIGTPKWLDSNEKRGKLFHVNVISPSNSKKGNTQGPTTNETSRDHRVLECKFCEDNHTIRECPQFETLSVKERIEFVQNNGCCYNCLAISHILRNCKSSFRCRYCGRRHHTLLHKPNSSTEIPVNTSAENQTAIHECEQSVPMSASSQAFSTFTQSCNQIDERKKLLGTAVLKVQHNGALFTARALIDPASDFSFISDTLRRRLNIPTLPIIAEISGINEVISARSDKICEVVLRSAVRQDFCITVQAIVVKTLTHALPTQNITQPVLNELNSTSLADPLFFQSRPIDFIIGCDYYPQIIRSGVQRNILDTLVAQDTEFGWVLTGPINERRAQNQAVSFFNSVSLEKTITRFWEIEEVPIKHHRSLEDEMCEEIFDRTICKLPQGRYQVCLPFRTPQIQLGHSRHIAMAQFLRNERKLMKTPELKKEYDNVLEEYIRLGHMVPVEFKNTLNPDSSYYLPHHAVVKPDRVTTKVRVVFNASSKTSNGKSLNDALLTGPTIQGDLVILILQWRFYKFVFNADIQKMYRQILLEPSHTRFQRILYRSNVNEPIRDYELKTVTFGVNSAPFLAVSTLHHLAKEVQATHPRASDILMNSMYVDDVLAGAHTLSDAKLAQNELISVLQSAGFPLRKWMANSSELLDHIPREHLLNAELLTLSESSNTKMLGIRWNAKSDVFLFDVPLMERPNTYTKRIVLSEIAKLFDPAGWLAPIIITAKIIMQQIWQDNTRWDESLSTHTLHKWNMFIDSHSNIGQIQIPRWIRFTPKDTIEFHGFSDASEKAYAAVLYARVIPKSGPVSVSLLFAKTRVAPIKVLSLPRLELCGAALLATMVNALLSQLRIPQYATHYWTDSSIVLAWLSKPPTTWKTFVANRVSIITRNTSAENWRHVASHDNPADIASRGCDVSALKHKSLWWKGPSWLSNDTSDWPVSPSFTTEMEAKTVKVFANTVSIHSDILTRFSMWSRAIRVLAYVYRFYFNTLKHRESTKFSRLELTSEEIKLVKDRLIIVCQKLYFPEEHSCLTIREKLPQKSSILTLNPFIDVHGIMRVNGRLVNAGHLSYNERYPVLIPYCSEFARLLVKHVHLITLHGGNQVMLRVLRSCYWIPKLKTMIRSTIHSCVPCVRYKNNQSKQLMAALPPERSTFSRPFTNTGVDFAGPFEVKSYSARCCKITKGYVCIFVCFSTKAIHLELTSDLSTPTFMAAFARFFSRRGCPESIYSDNGTNFVGAARMLRKERQEFINGLRGEVVTAHNFQDIKWHFIPPGAPHMGGLWEAGVKSFKAHLKKCCINQRHTFEELNTLLARIESCLNSRPLSPSSDDSEDLNPLTPGHFLIGTPLLTPAEPELGDNNMSLINRWQRLRVQHHYFCRRWKEEYLKELHKRYKWKYPQRSIQRDDMVVVRQDNTPPNEWLLGRVTKVYNGSDNRTRVVDLRTTTGVITRPITKLVVLPTN
ncbi:uncharacterized protein LOC142236428 [Haematobia irritans]|uniref:uncharacterized protein LOC142236428 n=1 Tax=Haematobia irritans TaxID=7368 RepID=UPI003F50AF38